MKENIDIFENTCFQENVITSSSWANMPPIVESNAEIYNFMFLFLIGGKRIIVVVK